MIVVLGLKKDANPLFDVTMGSFDGTEVCKLVGLYLLSKIKPLLHSSNVCFHRGDGLAIVHKANDPKVDRLRKDIINLFKDEGLSITIDTNLIETDFLGVSFNLNTGKYFSFNTHRIIHLFIYIQNPTTHRQSSSNCHQWRPTNPFEAYPLTNLSLTKLTQQAWIHLRCISEMSHTASQRHLKEGWFANHWDVSLEID